MPSALHQSLLELLRKRPSFAVELVRRLTDLELPKHDNATLTTDSLTPSEIGPLHPDAVILLSRRRAERDDVTVGVLVGEVQLKVRKDKIAAWSLHVPLAARIFGAPAYLLVVTPYEGVAEWVENLPAFGSVRRIGRARQVAERATPSAPSWGGGRTVARPCFPCFVSFSR